MSNVKEAHWDELRQASEREVGELRIKTAEANTRAAEATKRAESERIERLKLEARVAPRRLSGEQSSKMTMALSGKAHFPIAVVSRLMDSEGKDLGDDMASILVGAQWNVARVLNWTKPDKGVFVAIVEGTTAIIPNELTSALDAAQIEYKTITISQNDLNTASPAFQPNVLYLLVGAHP
ncbi:MAG TPA: hypothetical protein VJQ06_11915 [Rhizomicrobium sp.]|nr:hypothetical protein [Rhizomicrobium sp.]